MFRAAICCLVLVAFAAPAFAETIVVEAEPGLYLLQIKSGEVRLIPVQVVRPEPGPNPPPPNPDNLKELEESVGKLPIPALDDERRAVASLYRSVAAIGINNLADLQAATGVLFTAFLDNSDDLAGWETWKSGVDKAVAAANLEENQIKAAWESISRRAQPPNSLSSLEERIERMNQHDWRSFVRRLPQDGHQVLTSLTD